MRTGHISKIQCGRNKASCALDSQQWASEKNCSRLHSEVEQFGEIQKELPEPKHEIKAGSGQTIPKFLAGMLMNLTEAKGQVEGQALGEAHQSSHHSTT